MATNHQAKEEETNILFDWHSSSTASRSDSTSRHRYKNVAKKMNDMFESSKKDTSSSSSSVMMEQGRRNLRVVEEPSHISGGGGAVAHNDLRTMFEESFDNAQDVEEIFEDVYETNDPSYNGSMDDIAEAQETSQSTDNQDFTNNEDYYADLPDFVTHDLESSSNGDPSFLHQCKCLDCDEDEACGGIWKRERFANEETMPVNLEKIKIHMVVSHCMSDLDWIPTFTKAFPVASVHVITKCGKADRARETAPDYVTIQEYENVGRCDHTYAHYITTILPHIVKAGEEKDTVAIFLKDDISAANFHQSGHWNDFEGLVRAAASEHGFGCGIVPGGVDFGRDSFDLSTYHGECL